MKSSVPSVEGDVISCIAASAQPIKPAPVEYSATPPAASIMGKFVQFTRERRQAAMLVVDGLQRETQHERN